jgi:hypothetical protein
VRLIIKNVTDLPPVVAGPILRHCDAKQVNFWMVTSQAFQLSCCIIRLDNGETIVDRILTNEDIQHVKIGTNAIINLISIAPDDTFPENTLLTYNFTLMSSEGIESDLNSLIPDLVYKNNQQPNFVIKRKINKVLHGSCRKPHFESDDGLLQVDNAIADSITDAESRPALLMMSGDQIYADDVAGPMLVAIHQVIDKLGLYDECWLDDSEHHELTRSSEELFNSSYCYYQRENILPHHTVNSAIFDKVFGARKAAIFTSVNVNNHLVTLSEVMAMYLLVWSPELWNVTDLSHHSVPSKYQEKYQQELVIIDKFVGGLPAVRRALAHIPTYMIFDDHDVTDDWNLTRGWEEAAYNHSFSKQIIGNALIGYCLCQGWGNAPEKFNLLIDDIKPTFSEQGYIKHTDLIDKILNWNQWHYSLNTSPKIVVLDTRTQRWRSESNAGKPSGLMDWESLSALQQELINEPDIIMVSPAPIYGVKLIETIQRIFTFFGKPLAVDAENWMAHSGTANVMLNIFRHYKTPPNFIILSGDVHYSFVYEVTHRFRRNKSKILQITCSGIKNEFPSALLHTLERLNKYLYATYSPLNWFTKRRRMKIRVRKPDCTDAANDATLYNGSGIGLLSLSDDNQTIKAEIITTTGKTVCFKEI